MQGKQQEDARKQTRVFKNEDVLPQTVVFVQQNTSNAHCFTNVRTKTSELNCPPQKGQGFPCSPENLTHRLPPAPFPAALRPAAFQAERPQRPRPCTWAQCRAGKVTEASFMGFSRHLTCLPGFGDAPDRYETTLVMAVVPPINLLVFRLLLNSSLSVPPVKSLLRCCVVCCSQPLVTSEQPCPESPHFSREAPVSSAVTRFADGRLTARP